MSILVYLVYTAIVSAVSATFIGALIAPVLMFGVYSFFLIMARGGEVKIDTMFTDTFANFLKKWGAMLLTALYTWLWGLLFIIPGIVKSYAYAMTNYIMLDNPEMSVTDAIKESQKMMKGYKWKLFCLDLSFILWCMLIPFTCGLLSLYVFPLMQASRAQFYKELKEIKANEVA